MLRAEESPLWIPLCRQRGGGFRVYKEIVPLTPEPPRRRSAGVVGSLATGATDDCTLKGTAALRLSVHTVVGQGVPRAWVVPHGPWGMTVVIGQTLRNMMDGGSDLWDPTRV